MSKNKMAPFMVKDSDMKGTGLYYLAVVSLVCTQYTL